MVDAVGGPVLAVIDPVDGESRVVATTRGAGVVVIFDKRGPPVVELILESAEIVGWPEVGDE